MFKHHHFIKALFFLFTFISFLPLYAEEIEWKKTKQENGVTIYTREFAGSKVEEYLGSTEVTITISEILSLLLDPSACSYLYYNCKELEVISNAHRKSIVYLRNKAPWPVNDRDVLIERTVEQNEKTKVAYIHLKKTDSIVKLSPAGVTRMDSFQGFWKITPLTEGKLKIEYQGHFEPGGSLPPSSVNLVLSDTPFHTLLNLRKAIDEEKFKGISKVGMKERKILEFTVK